METDLAPPLGQVTLDSITGSDRLAVDSSLDPYSQPGRLKHTQSHYIWKPPKKDLGPKREG